jgi:hypothetical protein
LVLLIVTTSSAGTLTRSVLYYDEVIHFTVHFGQAVAVETTGFEPLALGKASPTEVVLGLFAHFLGEQHYPVFDMLGLDIVPTLVICHQNGVAAPPSALFGATIVGGIEIQTHIRTLGGLGLTADVEESFVDHMNDLLGVEGTLL